MSKNKKLNNIISSDECVAIVREHLSREDVRVIRHQVSRASEDAVGYLGEYLILKATIQDPSNESYEKHSYFIKCLPLDNEPLRQLLEDHGIFEKERTIYTTILQELEKYGRRKWHPECYFTRPGVIVLENLVSLGYEHISGRTKFSKGEAEAVLRNLASLHANSIIYEVKTGKNIGEVYGKTLFETSIDRIGWLLAGMKSLESVAKVHPKYQTRTCQKMISDQFCDRLDPIFDIVNESKKYKNVLCHRDAWHKNVFFKYSSNNNEVSSLLIDYQICRYCPPAVDVIFVIYVNIRKKERQQFLGDLIKYYYKELASELKYFDIDVGSHIPWDSFIESCDYVELFALFYAGIIETLTEIPMAFQNHIRETDPRRHEFYNNVDRSELVLGYMEKNDEYREHVFAAVGEMLEYMFELNHLS